MSQKEIYRPHKSTRYVNIESDKNVKKLPELYISRDNCCGCTACCSICPVEAISMIQDEEGFLCPTIDASKCIRCYKCLSVCSFKEDQMKKGYLENAGDTSEIGTFSEKLLDNHSLLSDTLVYAARVKDYDTLINSSSGGAFTALSDVFLSRGDAVVCCSYDVDSHEQRYMIAENSKERNKARGSKYVQSIPGDIFKKAEQWLKEYPEKQLLFIGMGCQAAGFIKYSEIKGFRDKVTVVDIICHGSPSPLIWKEYAKMLESKFGKIEKITFKDKRNGWNKPTAVAVIDGKEVSLKEYVKIFYSKRALRPSCHKCPYASVERYSDLTIGDYWNIEKKIPSFYNEKGNSLLIIHTEKGLRLFEKASKFLHYVESNTKDCLQPNLQKPTEMGNDRDLFWNGYYKHGIKHIARKYGNDNMYIKAKKLVKKGLRFFKIT